MKKQFKILLILLLTTITSKLNAQNYFGFLGGIYSGSVTVEMESHPRDLNLKIGPILGMGLEFGIKNKMSILTEFKYSQKGFRRVYNKTKKYSYKLNYIDFNLLYKYKFLNITNSKKKSKKINAHISTGLYIAQAISGKIKDLDNKEVEIIDLNEVGPSFEKYDFGLVGGIWVRTI